MSLNLIKKLPLNLIKKNCRSTSLKKTDAQPHKKTAAAGYVLQSVWRFRQARIAAANLQLQQQLGLPPSVTSTPRHTSVTSTPRGFAPPPPPRASGSGAGNPSVLSRMASSSSMRGRMAPIMSSEQLVLPDIPEALPGEGGLRPRTDSSPQSSQPALSLSGFGASGSPNTEQMNLEQPLTETTQQSAYESTPRSGAASMQ